MSEKIAAVVVTFNRLNKLKHTFESFHNQVSPPDYLIVVNNKSTDGTEDYLAGWQQQPDNYKKIVLNLEKNIGGSGGFRKGMEEALKTDADWIWVSDDDAYPDKYAFQNLRKDIDCKIDKSKTAAVCGKVLLPDLTFTYGHRKIWKVTPLRIKIRNVKENEISENGTEINLSSYIGTVFNREKLIMTDLTIADYFIYCDDGEHTLRLSKLGKIILFPDILVYHDITERDPKSVTWKLFYLKRNHIDLLKRNFPPRYMNFCYYKTLIMESIKIVVKKLIRYKSPVANRMIIEAIKDGKEGKLGVHPIYRPGWKA